MQRPSFGPADLTHIEHFEEMQRSFFEANPGICIDPIGPTPTMRELLAQGKFYTYVNHLGDRYLVFIETDPAHPIFTVVSDDGQTCDLDEFTHSDKADPTFAKQVFKVMMLQDRTAY